MLAPGAPTALQGRLGTRPLAFVFAFWMALESALQALVMCVQLHEGNFGSALPCLLEPSGV